MSSSRIRGLRGKRSTSPVATFDDTLRDDRRVREQTQLARQRRDQRAAELQAMLASTESKPRLPASARSRAGRLGSGSPPRSPRAVATSSAPLSLPLNVYTPPPLRTASALAAPHTPTAPPALLTSSTPTPSTDDLGAAPKAAAAVAAPAPSASSDRAAAYGVSSSGGRGNVMDVLRANRAKAAAEEAMQEPEAGAAGNAAADAGADAEEAAPTSADIKLGKYEVKFKTVIRAGVAKDSDKAGLVKVRPTIA